MAGGKFCSLEQALAHEIVLSGDTIRIAPGGTFILKTLSWLSVRVCYLGRWRWGGYFKGGSPALIPSNPSSNWYFPERYDYSIRVTADNVSLKI